MFKRLRNKFLLLNMSITSTVMIAAFAIIYFITYSNIHSEIDNGLNSAPGFQVSSEGEDLPEDAEKGAAKTIVYNRSLNNPLTFNIEVDKEGRILGISSSVDMADEAYYKAAEIALNNKSKKDVITLEGRQWRYAMTSTGMYVVQKNGQQYTGESDRYQIVFLDVTEYNKTLLELLTTLLFVGLIMLFAIYLISLYFANRAIKPIAETWEKQKQFVADASHELKTPLSIINANYDALLENQEETIRSQIKWLGYIRIGTDRMTKLINDLLSLARIEDVNIETQKVPFNISSTVNDMISSMEAVVGEKGIELSRSIEADIIVKSDPERVKQVATILFDNAIKYTNENGQIGISLAKSKRQVMFSIKNSGKGIAKKDLPRIFDRFYRADPSRTQKNGGYGLGLSIAKTVADRLGGEIYASSEENKCTTFTFTLRL